MVKSLEGEVAGYEPDKRSREWLKVKKDYIQVQPTLYPPPLTLWTWVVDPCPAGRGPRKHVAMPM
eukprot:2542851-Rhodomonas_salina.1